MAASAKFLEHILLCVQLKQKPDDYINVTIEKYRVIQDRLFMSDFDKYMLELEKSAKQ